MAKVVGKQSGDKQDDRFLKELRAISEIQSTVFRWTLETTISATSTTQVQALQRSPTLKSGTYRLRWYAEANGDGTRAPVLTVYIDGILRASTQLPATNTPQAWSGFVEDTLQSGTHSIELRLAATAAGSVSVTDAQLVLERLVA
jgi:hypothetical protein